MTKPIPAPKVSSITVTIKLRLGYPLGVLFLPAMDIDYGVLPLSRSCGLAQGTGRSVRA